MALLFLETLQCLGRPNYSNAVMVFGLYLALLVDLSEEGSEHRLCRAALRISLFATVLLIFLDIWYLIFGTLVTLRVIIDG